MKMLNQLPSNKKIKANIDADMLRYEVGFGVEFKEGDGKFIHNFEAALELLRHKIAVIQEEVGATEPPTLYLTQDKGMARRHKEEYLPNFREAISVTKEYKGTRASGKPFHYDNLTEYMLSEYECVIAKGMEADDLLSIEQNIDREYETVICSRDKDLRITPGWHYTWECGKAPAHGPHFVEKIGHLDPPVKSKIFGTGLKFFYAQMIMGDQVDNIQGIPGKGPAYAYKLLHECETEREMFDAVYSQYIDYILDTLTEGEDPVEEYLDESVERRTREYFKEQANLLWMVQELDEESNPVFYQMVDERE